ncbi:MAG: IclR family transcriptional regulator [Methanobacterium sp.]
MELIDRAINLITKLSYRSDGMSVLDLSEALNLAPSTTHRILSSLKENKIIVQDDFDKKYRIGYKLYSLVSNVYENNSLIVSAKPMMRKLSQQIKKTIVLCVMDGDHIINVYCIEQEDSNLFMVKIGKELPLFSTSAGRVYCAYMDQDKVLDLYQTLDEEANTPFTKTSWKDLVAEFERIRRQGYACIDEELQIGMNGFSCPIFDMNHKVVAALAFTSTKKGFENSQLLVQKLIECANQISTEIGQG